jgi:hypothetical protein
MKKLFIKENDLKNGVLLSSSESDTKLIRFDLDSYAVVVDGTNEPIYAFQSTSVSGILHAIDEPIKSVSVVLLLPLDYEVERQAVELRIFLEGGQVIICDSQGQIGVLVGFEYEISKEDRAAIPACEMWDLPDIDPYRKLLFSKKFIEKLSMALKTIPAKDVVDRIWEDFERVNKPLIDEDVVRVNGEFGSYALTELRCGRIVVMPLEETKEGK